MQRVDNFVTKIKRQVLLKPRSSGANEWTSIQYQTKCGLPRDIQRLLRVCGNLCSGTDFASTILSLHTTPESNFLVQNELPDDLHPAVVARQVAVEFIRDLVQLPKPGPRNSRKVVVLIVQADVVGQDVQNTVV